MHFYGIKDGSTVNIIKPYVAVVVQNNKGATLYWRLNRKDPIGEVKINLATSTKTTVTNVQLSDPDDNVKVQQLRLYLMSEYGNYFDELDDDDETVENYKIKDGDKLFLLTYRWIHEQTVTVTRKGRILQGLEKEDTCLGVKVKAQDQLGMNVSAINSRSVG